mgnify:CR=1 FL=1
MAEIPESHPRRDSLLARQKLVDAAAKGLLAESAMIASLQGIIGASPGLEVNYGWMLLYSLITLLCYDFIFFIIQLLQFQALNLFLFYL